MNEINKQFCRPVKSDFGLGLFPRSLSFFTGQQIYILNLPLVYNCIMWLSICVKSNTIDAWYVGVEELFFIKSIYLKVTLNMNLGNTNKKQINPATMTFSTKQNLNFDFRQDFRFAYTIQFEMIRLDRSFINEEKALQEDMNKLKINLHQTVAIYLLQFRKCPRPCFNKVYLAEIVLKLKMSILDITFNCIATALNFWFHV